MLKKLGIMINSLDASQLSFALSKNFNQLIEFGQHDPVVFYENFSAKLFRTNFGMLNEREAYSYNGPLISTDIRTTLRLLNFVGTREKYFYLWNLEWLYINNKDFNLFRKVYLNNDIKLIVRNKEHFEIVEKMWQSPVLIMPDFNYNQLIKVINNEY